MNPLTFYQDVAPSKAIRDASADADSLICDFKADMTMRVDVFKSMATAASNIKKSGKWEEMTSEEKRLFEKMVRLMPVLLFEI